MSDNYFIMRGPSDPKIVGVRNGGSQAHIDREGFSDKSNYDRYQDFFATKDASIWSKLDKIPNLDLTLEYVRLEKNAKMTDFLSYYPEAFRVTHLISERAVSVLERHQLPPYKKYPALVYGSGKDYALYYLFYLPVLDHNIINFQDTLFYEGDDLLGKEYLRINSFEEYKALKRKTIIDVESLHLNKHFDKRLDMFNTYVTYEFIISSRLKEAIVNERLTGINLIEAKGPKQMSVVVE